MIDGFGRNINYARLSVTDNCNLRCIYCAPTLKAHSEMLSANELIIISKALAELGITKIRITGGEPLFRKDLEEIVCGISKIKGIKQIPMTTNAVGLAERIEGLKSSGITRINISLDTLKEEKFKLITKTNHLKSVLDAIHKTLSLGIEVKINTVLMKGINDDEVDDLIYLAKTLPIEVRFIELMPIGELGQNSNNVIKNKDIIESHTNLKKIGRNVSSPCELYTADGFKGKVGFISPISHKFCEDCNRIRITCDGKLKLCIGSNSEISLVSTIKDGGDLVALIKQETLKKPLCHNFEDSFTSNRNMNRIGG